MVEIPGYEVQELLSWGSQGDVFRGRNGASELVAIKLVTADRTEGDPNAMLRLRREARLLAALDSPHIVKVREFLEGPDWSCLVLEFLAGERLDKALRRRAGLADTPGGGVATPSQSTLLLPVPQSAPEAESPARRAAKSVAPTPASLCTKDHVAWALDVSNQLATGLAEMHRVRLVHRDIKPQNVMFVDGRVVLIDFGFARRDGVTTMTQAGTAIGTLAYMAPELLAGSEANEASDVYALGATIYQCVTGTPPFGAEATTIRAMASRGRPLDVRRRNAAVDASLAAVIARCLEPDARDRYADAEQVLADLQRVARGEPVRVPFSPARTWRHHRRSILAMAMALVVAPPLAAWLSRNDLRRVAEQVRAAVGAGRDAAAVALWNRQPPGDRPSIVQHLNQLVATDAAEPVRIASVLGLSVLRFTTRAHHEIAVVPWHDEAIAPVAPEGAFVPAAAPTALLVQPGRVWCFVWSTDRSQAWAPDDPRCLQLLLAVGAGDVDQEPRRLDLLPTEPPQRPVLESVRFAAGRHPVRDNDWKVTEIDLGVAFAVAVAEASQAELWSFRRSMADQRANQHALDRWLRHPDEPDVVAGALWESWAATGPLVVGNQPARLGFWEAHRFAAWCGCRLPVLAEWRAAAFDRGRDAMSDDQQRVPDEFMDVDAGSAWDVTDQGVRHANSNIREWTHGRGLAAGGQWLALPGVERRNLPDGVRLMFSRLVGASGGQSPDQLHGVRLYRTLLGGAAR